MKPVFIKKDKEQYYDITQIDKTNATYRVIFGQRSNGKTYACLKKVLDAYFTENLPSVYIKRYAEDLKGANINMLFNPFLEYIKKKTKGKYNNVQFRNDTFTLVYISSDGKITNKAAIPLMYTAALSNWERKKGADRGEIKYFIFDEFATRSSYLSNEFVKFTNLHSSFVRSRPGVITYMIANTVNKWCPYFEEMGILSTENMKQGEIYLYKYNDDKLTVAVEYALQAEHTKKTVEEYYAFENEALKMIRTGDWETDNYPHIPHNGFSVSEHTMLFKFFLKFGSNVLIGELHQYRNEAFLFFHRFGDSKYIIKDTDLVYTDEPTMNLTWLHTFSDYPFLVKENANILKVINIIHRAFTMKKIYFASNSVGEIVRNFVLNPFEWMTRK